MIRSRSLPFVLLIALCSALAAAQGPKGIAYVEAPERAAGVCVAGSPDKGFACARERCAEPGVPGNECLRRAWCYPAGWSVDMFLQDRNGIHWHEFTCGLPSRELAQALAKLKCEPTHAERYIECTPVRYFDPDGREIAP